MPPRMLLAALALFLAGPAGIHCSWWAPTSLTTFDIQANGDQMGVSVPVSLRESQQQTH